MASTRNRRRKEQKQVTEQDQKCVLELIEKLDEQQLSKLFDKFNSNEEKQMNEEQLKEVLIRVANIQYTDEEFKILFKKINLKRNGWVTWDEFISYLMLTCQRKSIKVGYTSLDNAIPNPPLLIRSKHRYTVNKIYYFPTMRPDRTVTWQDGSVLTSSHDGTINYWSLDMRLERTVQSSCPDLKVQSTWITDLVPMPDVSIICTSSTERDLRFYDTSARKFELRVMFTSVNNSITSMYYMFDKNVEKESKLFLGDIKGNVQVILIESKERGPFKSKPGLPLLSVRYNKVTKGLVKGFRVITLKPNNTEFIRQISYYQSLESVVYCTEHSATGLVMTDLTETKINYIYVLPKGAWCFAILESRHVIASGGSDCLVRLWNVFVPQIPTAILYGHHAGIISMIFQDDGKLLYSLSNDRCIKVWNVMQQACLQTYLDIPPKLGKQNEISTLYNPESRQWIIGSSLIAIVPLSPLQKSDHTDGVTHIGGISVILYNPLFKSVITCGLDSYIIVWNPWDGRRMLAIPQAHTKTMHAELIPVEITAATFDPGYQRLLTGAHDGTLKIWNFHTGTCQRNLKLDEECEIKSLFWINNRILAMGWNKRITEFSDSNEAVGSGGEFFKNWALRHDEEISAGAVRIPQTIVSGTYNGDLILWQIETGQPYKQYNVSDPTTRIKITLSFRPGKNIKSHESGNKMAYIKKRSIIAPLHNLNKTVNNSGSSTRIIGAKKISNINIPLECIPLRKLTIHCMLFLSTRPMDPNIGTLLVSLENGTIQVWSHHISGRFMTSFTAIHKAGDYVVAMGSDLKNEFLFTGSARGYIKIWLMKNYCTTQIDEISMPKYRLKFPFLWHDMFVGRAARIARSQPEPILLNSFRGHLMPISAIIFIDEAEIIISSSTDFTARLWTIGGRYIQTLGTFKQWKPINTDGSWKNNFEYTIPPDIRKVASSTTFRVLLGGPTLRHLSLKQQQKQTERAMTIINYSKVYGERLNDSILGNYQPEKKTRKRKRIIFDTFYPYIPIYQHFIMPSPAEKY